MVSFGRSVLVPGCWRGPRVLPRRALLRSRHLTRLILRPALVHPVLRRSILGRTIIHSAWRTVIARAGLVHPVLIAATLWRTIVIHPIRGRAVIVHACIVIAAPVIRRIST
jgi:hypothetical protein